MYFLLCYGFYYFIRYLSAHLVTGVGIIFSENIF